MALSKSDQARLNGAKSRGPKTPEGKARSSLNALKHGRYATHAIVLSNEDAEAFEDLIAIYVRRIQPVDQMEYQLTRELASIDWRLTRITALDTRSLDHEMEVQAPALAAAGKSIPELTRVHNAGQAITDRTQYPNYLARREAQLIRARLAIYRVLRELRKFYPPSEPTPEVIPPLPLNAESPDLTEPETNPSSGSGADPLVCAEPPGSASESTPTGPTPVHTPALSAPESATSNVAFSDKVALNCGKPLDVVPDSTILDTPIAGSTSGQQAGRPGGRPQTRGSAADRGVGRRPGGPPHVTTSGLFQRQLEP